MKMSPIHNKIRKNQTVSPDKPKIKDRSARKSVLIVLLVISGIAISYSYLETFCIEEKVYTLTSSEIPAKFNNTRIIFLADIHHGIFFPKSRVKQIVKRTNELNPGIVLLGGDYVSGGTEFIEPCFEALSKLKAPMGVFGVLGNHDHWHGADLSRKALDGAGIKSIDNGAFWVVKEDQKIRIGGVGDHCEDYQDLDITVSDVKTTDFVILVSHNPDYAPEMQSNKVDMVLSGHTHGGQITFFGLFAPKVPSRYGQKFRTGKIVVDNTQVIISNGIGTVFVPLRFFARPQIVIVELKCI